MHDKESRCVPETEKLTEAYAKEEILKKVSDEELQAEIRAANALHCKIVKIAHGKPTAKLDPHGMKWAVYDPLAQVGFYNPKEIDEWGKFTGTAKLIARERLPGDVLPASYHNQTLYCFMRAEGPAARQPSHGASQPASLDSEPPPDGPWRTALESAINAFKAEQKLYDQQGTSNAATPRGNRAAATPIRDSALAVRLGKPRQPAICDAEEDEE